MTLSRLLIPAALLLLYPGLRTAVADVLRLDVAADRSVTTASIDGTPAAVPSGLIVSRHDHAFGLSQSFTLYIGLRAVGENGPIIASGDTPADQWCDWDCVVGSFNVHIVRAWAGPGFDEPLSWPPGVWLIGGRDLWEWSNQAVAVHPSGTGYVVLIGDPGRAVNRADFDHDGTIGPADLFSFLDAYFRVAPEADFNADGAVSVGDIFDFLAAYLEG